ncbi:MAG: ABC transporter permease [Actinobacteria bacterium]|nr:ABC transporter permease [Actinomycetota bacterium]
MRKVFAIARRILSQFRHDHRTLALLFLAPTFVLWLFSVLLGTGAYIPRLATVDLPADFQTVLEAQDVMLENVSKARATELLEANEVDAVLYFEDESELTIWVEGSDASKTAACLAQTQAAMVELQKDAVSELESSVNDVSVDIPDQVMTSLPVEVREALSAAMTAPDFAELMPIRNLDITYLHGSDDWTRFDFFGPVFIGIFLFVFVFLTSGMSLVTERSGGTMERFLTTPIKPWQVVGGYSLGFGLLALMQSVSILWAIISLIGFPNEGSLVLVVLVVVSMALVSLTLGLLVSGLAKSSFQVIQLMILFVVPQILLSGIFDLSQAPTWLRAIASCFPIYYGADALRDVMLRGAGFTDIAINLTVLWGFIVAFFALATISFRKKRARLASRTEY